MKPQLILTLTSLLAVSLAGCADAPAAPAESGGDSPETEAGLAMPEWAVGDWWTYDSPFATGTFAVSEDTGNAWIIDTDNQEWAFYHAEIESTSYMGEQRKSDLAGSQGTDTVLFFDWPLTDGKTWTTPWDGETLTITAKKISDTTFQLEGRAGDALRVSYEYRASIGWFNWISFFDAEGTEVYRMQLSNSGSNYADELVRVNAEVVYAQAGQAGASSTTFDPFNAPEDSDLYLIYAASCPEIANGNGGLYAFALGPVQNIEATTAQNDDGFNDSDQCPHDEQFSGVIGWNPNEGNWGFVVEAPLESQWSFELYLRSFERITL